MSPPCTQSIALRKINGAIGAMDQMTQQNAAMVEETNAATKNLTQEAGQLYNAFSSFRIGREERRTLAPVPSPVQTAPKPRSAAPAPSIPMVSGNLAIDSDWSEF